MKISSAILLGVFIFMLAGIYLANVLLKKEYGKVDKSDVYWTYGKILEQPFRYLKIDGGNITKIAFEQSAHPSVRVYKNWTGYQQKLVTAFVHNDTLFVKYPNTVKDIYDKIYQRNSTLLRIFSPQLLYVEGVNTNLGLYRLKQKSIDVNMSGKSQFEVESDLYDLNNIRVKLRDSSAVVFEMSPELKGTDPSKISSRKLVVMEPAINGDGIALPSVDQNSHSWETIFIRNVYADIGGASILDMGHAQIDSLNLKMDDTSAIILAGSSVRKLRK